MDNFIRQMLIQERDREEAEERARNNGRLSAAKQASHAAADRSEATTRQMQASSSAAGVTGIEGPSGPFLGRWEMPNTSGDELLKWENPRQHFGEVDNSSNQPDKDQQNSYSEQGSQVSSQQGNTQQRSNLASNTVEMCPTCLANGVINHTTKWLPCQICNPGSVGS